MNKLSLIFTALRAYKQARGQETTTLRGVICGTLAAASIAGLWWMGADLTADQISLVMGVVYGVDTVLKIVLPDRFGGTHDDETVPALPPIELQGGLGLTLALCALLMGCASPWKPTLDPARIPSRIQWDGTTRVGAISSLGVNCEWRY